ncbi:hypothetical protein M3Y97_00039400 [Aphelenchoides bicaudatus]|nr:hypothetical protein M3Y97_00039400 [Aphelenchoides bicaudatus]
MPSKKTDNASFADVVQPALQSLLTDLERTTEILRRAGKKSQDDKWDSTTSFQSGTDYASRYSSNNELQSGRNSQRVDSMNSPPTDYQTIPKGDCALCGDAIVGEVIIALGNMWHPQHFNCCHCGDEIGHKNFFERSGKAYCEKDYHDLFSPRCSYCNGPITGRCINALGSQFHPEHFNCAECGRQFGDEGFHEKNGQPLCKEDFYRLYAPKCEGCQNAITSKYITALDTHWHPECFVCDVCERPVGGSFFNGDGVPLCELHYHQRQGSLCAHCQHPIAGRCISAMGRKFHPSCFTCCYCSKKLLSGTYRDCRGRPYCNSCYEKIR